MASSNARTQPIHIGLLWHSASSGNLGVGALSVADMAIVGDVARSCGLAPRFTVIGFRDAAGAPLFDDDVALFPMGFRELLGRSGLSRLVRGLDIVVDIGLGDSFADIYGPKRFAMLWLSKAIALRAGVPLVMAPQTIGPFDRQPYRGLAGWAMARAAAVVARDERSLEAARAIAPGARHILSADVAFELPFADRSAERNRGVTRIGVNASGLLFREAESGGNRFGLSYDYAAFTRTLLRELTERPDTEVHLVPHVIDRGNAADDDAVLADALARDFPAAVRAPDFASPSDAKSYISGLDLLVAARMHACIAAFSSGTPVVPVAYSRKFSGLFGMLGFDRIVPAAGIDAEGALDMVRQALADPAALAAAQNRGTARARELLANYRAELRRIFTEWQSGQA